ncbi:hypothetical protein TeGR_g8503 [Tetraparma gracilis]|uniref:Flavodoxin-like domain-containing protein n=1 Tax=Tetraparma gracilis TaxID=2962635 RepID=A0ABQ6MUL5_9STRA|nr:hypothetical protein TeGR_g8503 [Tetraparma gracilis]
MESIAILYASQTGNSESSAEQLHSALSASHPYLRLSISRLDDWVLSTTPSSAFPDYLLVISSSYGVGQPPLGGEIYRAVLDHLAAPPPGTPAPPVFEGVPFSLLGHGSRSYPTFFRNPRALAVGMKALGARLVATSSCEPASASSLLSPGCPGVGVADASGETADDEEAVRLWIEEVKAKLPAVEAMYASESPSAAAERRSKSARNRSLLLRAAEALMPEEVAAKREDLVSAGVLQGGGGGGADVGTCRFIVVPLVLGAVAVALGVRMRGVM